MDKDFNERDKLKSKDNKNLLMTVIFSVVTFLVFADIIGIYLFVKNIDYVENKFNNTKISRPQETSTTTKTVPNSADNKISQGEVSPEMAFYMKDMQSRIKMNWEPPKKNVSSKVVLLFKINKNGELLNYSIFESSGDNEIDTAAINALKKTAPFHSFPKNFKENSVNVQFSFDYNVIDKHNQKR